LAHGNFRELQEQELTALDDDGLIDYIRNARAAGKGDAVTLALRILVFGYLSTVERRVALKVPPEDVADVALDAMESAIRSAFDGESVGEFRSWMHTIVNRRIVDYWRSPQRKLDTVPLPEEHEREDDQWGDVSSVQFEGVAVDAQKAIDTAYQELNAEHQRVIDLYVFDDRPAAEAAQETGASEQNVHQIASRYRRRVRELLDNGDTRT